MRQGLHDYRKRAAMTEGVEAWLDRDVIARAICEPGLLGHYDSESGSQLKWRCQQIADRVIEAIASHD